jgi:hypothetical protein
MHRQRIAINGLQQPHKFHDSQARSATTDSRLQKKVLPHTPARPNRSRPAPEPSTLVRRKMQKADTCVIRQTSAYGSGAGWLLLGRRRFVVCTLRRSS